MSSADTRVVERNDAAGTLVGGVCEVVQAAVVQNEPVPTPMPQHALGLFVKPARLGGSHKGNHFALVHVRLLHADLILPHTRVQRLQQLPRDVLPLIDAAVVANKLIQRHLFVGGNGLIV